MEDQTVWLSCDNAIARSQSDCFIFPTPLLKALDGTLEAHAFCMAVGDLVVVLFLTGALAEV